MNRVGYAIGAGEVIRWPSNSVTGAVLMVAWLLV